MIGSHAALAVGPVCTAAPGAAAQRGFDPPGAKGVWASRPGLNTYEAALKALVQPTWVEIKQDTKKILQKLTALSITAHCDGCRPTEGMLIVDNIAFEK